MLGLILDNIIVYLFRHIRRLLEERRSSTWPTAEGTVEKSSWPTQTSYPLAEVLYKYTVDGNCYSGIHKRAFWFESAAKNYAEEFPPAINLVVRYKPGEPIRSVVHYWDQFASITEDGKTVWGRIFTKS